jgi:RHS repeat-associated protein
VYLFAGEQFDPALGLYYNRARYLNTTTGRFWSMDTYEGQSNDPLSLHKFVYASSNPVDDIDPTGNDEIAEQLGSFSVGYTIAAMSVLSAAILVGISEVPAALKAAINRRSVETASTFESARLRSTIPEDP